MTDKSCYLAIDIGASSGRHILGWMENGKLRLEEIYRFENRLETMHGLISVGILRISLTRLQQGSRNALHCGAFRSRSASTHGVWISFCWTSRGR